MADEARRAGLYVRHRIEAFAGAGDSTSRATLAILRRGIGRLPGSMPELWGATFHGFPEDLMGAGKSPSHAEWAVHTALTLYALHQQGKPLREDCMHRDEKRLGISVRELVHSDDDEARVKRRFDAVATSDSLIELANHLRGLIQLLKSGDIALDYVRLTEDIYRYQFSEARDSVRLNWGRDFYRSRQPADAE